MGKVVKTVGKLALGTVGSIIGAKLIGGKKKSAPAEEKGPIVMPLADDESARARKAQEIMRRKNSGRSSTILSSGSTLGG